MDEDGKALFWPGVKDTGGWERAFSEAPHSVPVETGFLAAPAESGGFFDQHNGVFASAVTNDSWCWNQSPLRLILYWKRVPFDRRYGGLLNCICGVEQPGSSLGS